ncbi:hypothetical protein FRC01_002674 [Tulasnella sp. 417]|nr:hypothetical protein FRC01_002674 [Tulasnella sp. 417]
MDEDGEVTTHSYCGIACYKASFEQNGFPSSTVSVRGAEPDDQGALNLRVERLNTPIGRKILNTVQERWKSDEIPGLQVKGIYRIDLPGQVYRRFDLALQMNDLFSVSTTYYGALATCGITDDADPSPCASEACELCDALRSSFGNLLYGASCRDGSYGPGLYTYLNPALAHDAADVDDDPQGQNYALIQCRVEAFTGAGAISSLGVQGFLDDSGVVFCAQPTAVIPTHLLTYRLGDAPTSRQAKASANSKSAAKGQIASGVMASPGGPGRTKSAATGPKSPNGKGQALANLPLQKPQRQSSVRGSPMGSSLVKQVDQDPATSATPGSDPATTSLRALVKLRPGTPTGTRSPPPYGQSGAGSQKAARQLPYPPTGSIGDPLGDDSDDDPGSYPAAARKYVKRSRDLESRLDEDEDDYSYLDPNKNFGRREDEDSDELPDHPPGHRA